MKQLNELIDTKESGWILIKSWLETAKNEFEMLPNNINRAESELLSIQVTTRSSMGAMIYETGGLLIDHGWLRVCGYFSINCGGLGENLGDIYYLAPDCLRWENLEIGYSDFLNWCLNGDLDQFYGSLRWNNWKTDIQELTGNQVFSFYPFLWTLEGKNIDELSKKAISIEENFWLLDTIINEMKNLD